MVNGFVPCVHLFIALSVRPLEFGLVEPDMGINPGLVPHGVVKGRSQSWCTVRAACAHNATLERNEFLGYGLACFIYALVVGSTVLVLLHCITCALHFAAAAESCINALSGQGLKGHPADARVGIAASTFARAGEKSADFVHRTERAYVCCDVSDKDVPHGPVHVKKTG
jgi:hypothetical protein